MSGRKVEETAVSDDQISELQAAFEFYGAKNDRLKKEDLRLIMNKLNLPAKSDVIDRMMKEGDVANLGYMDFTGFMTMMTRHMQKSDNEATLMEAFSVFDPQGNGYVSTEELHKYLVKMGDRLNDSEWEAITSIADKEGKFYYSELVKEIFGSTK